MAFKKVLSSLYWRNPVIQIQYHRYTHINNLKYYILSIRKYFTTYSHFILCCFLVVFDMLIKSKIEVYLLLYWTIVFGRNLLTTIVSYNILKAKVNRFIFNNLIIWLLRNIVVFFILTFKGTAELLISGERTSTIALYCTISYSYFNYDDTSGSVSKRVQIT